MGDKDRPTDLSSRGCRRDPHISYLVSKERNQRLADRGTEFSQPHNGFLGYLPAIILEALDQDLLARLVWVLRKRVHSLPPHSPNGICSRLDQLRNIC